MTICLLTKHHKQATIHARDTADERDYFLLGDCFDQAFELGAGILNICIAIYQGY